MTEADLADAAQLASMADETPEGRSIVVLAKRRYGLRGRELCPRTREFVPFTAQTRMSGVNLDGREIRKGASEAIAKYVAERGIACRPNCRHVVEEISSAGGTPLLVAGNGTRAGRDSALRTSSRAGCASALISFARWAFAP